VPCQTEAEEAAQEESRLLKARADPLAFSEEGSHSTDQLPGQWVETIVAVDRVQKIITGGSIMSYRVLVVVGNAMGAGGYGVGKALDPASATARAIRAAKKSLVVVDRFKMTGLVHSVEGKHNSCRVVLRAVPPGYGMKGGRIATAILTSMGIGDCTAKSVGRRTPFAVVRVSSPLPPTSPHPPPQAHLMVHLTFPVYVFPACACVFPAFVRLCSKLWRATHHCAKCRGRAAAASLRWNGGGGSEPAPCVYLKDLVVFG
jgi:small subunit ribosomal protein S5